jgi:multicomponent Na+:H+ antiporter subunit C
MSSALLYALAGVWITVTGLRGVLAEEAFFRKIVGANIMGSGVFLLLVALARRAPGGPPDPVPRGMILTGIVVAVSATALMLALLGFLKESGSGEGEEDE